MFRIFYAAIFLLNALMPSIVFASCSKVSIISFDIELYAPESEETIASRAHQVLYVPTVLSNNIYWAAYKSLGETEYDSKDVRAVISTDNGFIYIDRFGWVRSGDKYGKIDKWAFERSLLSDCKD